MNPSDQAFTTVNALLENMKRLGILPTYHTGTVYANTTATGRAMVLLDNDAAPTPVFNYAGPLATGQRVITIAVPPHGLYAIGAVSLSPIPVVTQYTVTGTARFTKPTGLVYARVQVQAAGGAGAGASTTIAGQWSFGDGGGGGEYAEGLLLASQISDAGEIVTVGQGGISVSAGSGGNGTASSFGSLITTVGGGGGTVRAATTTANFSSNTQTRNGGSGGTGGTIRVAGSPGGVGIGINSTTTGVRGGDGGQSFLGGGFVENLNGAGNAGRTPGGGGSGAANSAGNSAVAGGTGGNGTVIVTSYFA